MFIVFGSTIDTQLELRPVHVDTLLGVERFDSLSIRTLLFCWGRDGTSSRTLGVLGRVPCSFVSPFGDDKRPASVVLRLV